MTAYRPIGCKLKQSANECCNSRASLAGLVLCFVACFILLAIALLESGSVEYNKSDFSSDVLSVSNP